MHILKYFGLSYIRMQKYFLIIHTYIMQRRILKMYNKSKLTVTEKCLIGAKRGPDFINATTVNTC